MKTLIPKALGPALLAVGGVLLYYGYQTQQSLGSQVEELVTGSPSDKALYLFIGGGLALALGAAATFAGFKGKKT